MVKKEGPRRRDVLAGMAAASAVALMPVPAVRPEFASAYRQFMEAWADYERAREAAYLARPRTMALVRKTDITSLFRSPEVKARKRTRIAAQQAAEGVYGPEAASDEEAGMQEIVIRVCQTMLGVDDGLRNRYPPTRRFRV